MPTLGIGDSAMSYEDYGSGPVVLLIHGSPGNAKAWLRVGERLADRYRIIAPDLPGYSATTPQDPGAAPDTTHAVELIEALVSSVGPPTVLAGHSYGGVVALAVALRQRIPIGALVLFEPVALRILPVVGEVAEYEAAKATFREEYTLSAFAKLAVPILAVCGSRSPAVTRQIAKTIAAHAPMGSFASLEDADHALTTTHVDAVAEAISNTAANAAHPPPARDAPQAARP